MLHSSIDHLLDGTAPRAAINAAAPPDLDALKRAQRQLLGAAVDDAADRTIGPRVDQ
jgi:hypothetical protein